MAAQLQPAKILEAKPKVLKPQKIQFTSSRPSEAETFYAGKVEKTPFFRTVIK